jgi:bifunctional DNA-binding transcriptional regulator/antitoxin component of YhaV-PrlF toxin-antitoxin module
VEGEEVAEGMAEEEDIFEELVVLDSAGRLQVPKEYLEYFGIKGRVRLELSEDGIMILPAVQTGHAHAAETYAADLAAEPEARGWRSHKAFKFLQTAGNRASGVLSRFRRSRQAGPGDDEGEQ